MQRSLAAALPLAAFAAAARVFTALVFTVIVSPAAAAVDSGSPLWRRALGGSLLCPPAASGGVVAALAGGGRVVATSSGGRPLWTWRAHGELAPVLALAGEAVYVGETSGQFTALSIAGRERWNVRLDGPVLAPPLAGWDGRVFVWTAGGLSCFTEAGQQLWRLRPEFEIALPPVSDGRGGLVLALGNGRLLLVDPYGQAKAAQIDSLPALLLGPGADTAIGFALAFFDGRVEVWGQSGRQRRLERALAGLSGAPAAGAVFQDKLLAVDAAGNAVLVSLANGAELWQAAGLAGDASLVFDGRGIFALSKTAAVSVDPATGKIRARRDFGDGGAGRPETPPGLGEDGRLYTGGGNWLLYAWGGLETPAPAAAPSGPHGYGMAALGSLLTEDIRHTLRGLPAAAWLETIAGALAAGNVGGRERLYKAALYAFAASGTALSPEGLFAELPTLPERLRALRLLGRLGSRETTLFLANLWLAEGEDAVKAEMARAAGRIGADPERAALAVFTREFRLAGPLHDGLFTAIAGALGGICRFSGPEYARAAVPLLAALAGSRLTKKAAETARAELQTLGEIP